MKKVYLPVQIALILLLSTGISTFLKAQVSGFSFSQSVTAYSSITGGTLLGSTGSDDQKFVNPAIPLGFTTDTGVGFPIGFNFSFNGIIFDRLAVNNNGWISLGQSTLSPSVNIVNSVPYGPLASTSVSTPSYLRNRIAGFVKDLQGQAGSSLRVETIGTTPNRACVIQWDGYRRINASGDTLSFQIRLNETTNVAEVHFSKIVFGGATASLAQVGLGGTTSSDFNSRFTATDWNNTTAATANNQGCLTQAGVVYPVSGRLFSWTPPFLCSGTPTAGTTVSSLNPVCSGRGIILSLNGAVNTGGITHQWISSTDGVNYAFVPAATDTVLGTTITTATYFRCIATCPANSQSDTSTALHVMLNPTTLCYCNTGLNGSCGTVNAEIHNVNISTTTLNNTSGCNVIGGNAYISFPDTGSATATLLQTVPYTFNVNCSAAAIVSVWIDYNQNGQFDTIEWTQIAVNASNATGTINIPISALTGSTGMRVRSRIATYPNGAAYACVNFSSGETEDYIITIGAAPACVNPPLAGNISGLSSVCAGGSVSLQVSGQSVGTSLQWESSLNGSSWNAVAGAVNTTYVTPLITDTIFYRVKVKCTDSLYTGAFEITLNSFLNCYCTPAPTDCSLDDVILNVNFAGINNSTFCATDGYAVYPSPSASVQQGSTNHISVTVGAGGDEYVGVWIDYNHNGSFDSIEFTAIGSANGATIDSSIAVPIGAALGLTAMRVRLSWDDPLTGNDQCWVYDNGETEDYLVNITAPIICTTPSVGGTASGPATGTPGLDYLYIVTGSVGNIQWQNSDVSSSGPFADIPGANNDSLTANFSSSGTFWIRAYVISPGCDPDSSNTVQTVLTLPGDNVCDALPLNFGSNGPFNTAYAAIESGEPAPPGNGCSLAGHWCNSSITNTLWFKFIAPASGRVTIQSPGFDTQLALWDASACADILTGGATLVAANDDDLDYVANNGVQYSSTLDSVSCLFAGRTYYVQLDAHNAPGDTTSIILTDLGGTSSPLNVALHSTTNVTCHGFSNGAIDIDVSGGSGNYSYMWDSGETTQDISGLSGGTFEFTVTDPGCGAVPISIQVTVNEPGELIALDSLIDVRCFGDNNGQIYITLQGGTAPYDFSWSNGATSQNISGLNADFYTLNVIDSNGCTLASPPYPISAPTSALSITVDSITDNQCAGGHAGAVYITVSGGTAGYNYIWSDGATTEDNTGLTANIYHVTVHDANACTAVPATGVVGVGNITITISVDSVINARCHGENTGAVYITPHGSTGYNYVWSNTASTADIINVPAGSYSVVLTDVNGCSATAAATVGQPTSGLSASSTHTNQIQGGALGSIDVTRNGGTPPYHSLWNNSDTSEDRTNLVAGIYSCTITDANGCTTAISDTVDFVTGIENAGNLFAVSLYPNPTQDKILLDLKLNEISNVEIEIFEIGGRIIHQFAEKNVLTALFEMNFANEPAGVYYAKIKVGETTFNHRIVVAR